MGKAAPRRLSDQVSVLERALSARERAALLRSLRALVRWQRALRHFPRLAGAPDATPYVSLYARGVLRGCYGSSEGAPGERLARAFLLALADRRYGGIAPEERASLEADVAYITRVRPVRADEAVRVLEPGVQGVARVDDGRATVLLPSVAREKGHDAKTVLDLLALKAAAPASNEGLIWLLDMQEVSSRGIAERDPMRAARRFLESLVGADGSMAFELEPATGATRPDGTMRHGRIAVAAEALAALGSPKARRVTSWLSKELRRGIALERPDMMLGTLALAARAGVRVELASLARSVDPATSSPWHAAQAASVLGKDTPAALWDRCVRDLDVHPLAPYTLMAARRRDDGPVIERCAAALVTAIRTNAPFAGGASFTDIPETALTSVTVEALEGLRPARQAIRLARTFIESRQIRDVPASMTPAALGAFRASPVAPVLRCDITGHAVLALRGGA